MKCNSTVGWTLVFKIRKSRNLFCCGPHDPQHLMRPSLFSSLSFTHFRKLQQLLDFLRVPLARDNVRLPVPVNRQR